MQWCANDVQSDTAPFLGFAEFIDEMSLVLPKTVICSRHSIILYIIVFSCIQTAHSISGDLDVNLSVHVDDTSFDSPQCKQTQSHRKHANGTCALNLMNVIRLVL